MYMDCVDELMNYTPQQEIEKDEFLGLFDFAAPIEMWGWKRVISLVLENPDLFYGYTTSSLGRELTDISKDNTRIKRRRTSAGVWYFLPPFKERVCK
jgi:hypothetical protein